MNIHIKLLNEKSLNKIIGVLIGGTIVSFLLFSIYFRSFHYLIIAIPILIGLINLFFIHFIYRHIYKMKDDYQQLADYIQLKESIGTEMSLPPLRGYAGSPDFLNIISHMIKAENPKSILEASCGASTIVISETLLKEGKEDIIHFALEHDKKYLDECAKKVRNTNSNILYAPLQDYTIENEQWKWYNVDGIANLKNVDLLVIDGPPSHLQADSRFPALPLLYDQLSDQCIIILDDFDRKQEQNIIARWQKNYAFTLDHLYTEKGTGILRLSKK